METQQYFGGFRSHGGTPKSLIFAILDGFPMKSTIQRGDPPRLWKSPSDPTEKVFVCCVRWSHRFQDPLPAKHKHQGLEATVQKFFRRSEHICCTYSQSRISHIYVYIYICRYRHRHRYTIGIGINICMQKPLIKQLTS